MAGISLKCGGCRTLLKSVEEALEHAELIKHINFVESTEVVLNLFCSNCGKLCRSKISDESIHEKECGNMSGFALYYKYPNNKRVTYRQFVRVNKGKLVIICC